MKNRMRPIVATLIALVLHAVPAWSEPAEWDQSRATELAIELNEVVIDLQRSFRRELSPSVASGQARARHRFRDTLRVLRTETRALASQLESGAGVEETRPITDRIGRLVRDLRQDGRRMSWMEPVLGHARRAGQLIEQLAPFYAEPAG